MKGVRNVMKVSELNRSLKERAHQERCEKYEVLRVGMSSVEKKWEKLNDIVKECIPMM